jgi:hypothetical protein
VKLTDVLADIDRFSDDLTICAADPWSPESAVVLVAEPDGDGDIDVPNGHRSLLEIDLVRHVLEVWSRHRDGALPNLAQRCQAVIHYAREDCYLDPDLGIDVR